MQHNTQNQAQKINALIGHLGLKQSVIAKKIGVHHTSMSRKVQTGTPYTNEVLEKISMELGVTVAFLRDTSRIYNEGDPIPEDAILKPPPEAQGDLSDTISKLMAIQAQNIAHNQAAQVMTEIKVLAKANIHLTEIIKELAEQVKEMRDERDGNHDPD